MNIVLCGMMGAGKSSVGKRVAELTGRTWYDTDSAIAERFGKISTIFEQHGEEYFRILEADVVREIASHNGLVISTGGGLVLNPENNVLLKRNGKIFYLRANLETLSERVQEDGTRPLLNDAANLSEKLGELLAKRTPVYESIADVVIDTDGKSVNEVTREIIARVEAV